MSSSISVRRVPRGRPKDSAPRVPPNRRALGDLVEVLKAPQTCAYCGCLTRVFQARPWPVSKWPCLACAASLATEDGVTIADGTEPLTLDLEGEDRARYESLAPIAPEWGGWGDDEEDSQIDEGGVIL